MHQINYDLALKNIVPILYKNDDKLGYQSFKIGWTLS